MSDQLELLKQLQALDGELFRLRRQEREKPREIEQAAARAAAQELQLKASEEKLSILQRAQKEKEIELQTREEQMKKLQGQLFQVKTNKEYSAMQREIDSLKADKSLLEEVILRGFDLIEEATRERKDRQGQAAAQQQALRDEQERVQNELAEIASRIDRFERSRRALTPQVPPATLAAYERVLGIREGLALVPVVHESCGGCHRRLPPQVVSQACLAAQLVSCEHCNRILYFDEAQSQL